MKSVLKKGLIFIIFMTFSSQVTSETNSCQSLDGKTLNIALSSRPNNLNPFFSTDANSQNLNRLIHKTLVDFNAQMKFECRLCEKYERRFKEDGREVIYFKLKENVTFWDGSPVTSKDVYNSWKYFSDDEKINSVFRFAFQKIEKIKILNDRELEIHYDSFYLDSLSNLVLLKIIKIEQTEQRPVDLNSIMGAGPYRVNEQSPLSIVLSPAFDEDLPVLDFKIVRDETTLALKLINNEIDYSVAHMSPRKVDWLRENHSEALNFWEKETSNFIYMSLNHRREALSQREIRQALALLIPREKIIEYKLRNTATLSHGMFSKAFKGLGLESDPNNHYDPERGREILKEFGFTKQNPLVIDWKSPSTRSTLEVVNTITHFLEQGPIQVNVTMQEWGTFMRSFRQGRYDIVLGQWIGFTGPEMLDFAFHSSKIPPDGGNRGHFKDEKLDHFLDQALEVHDEKERRKIFREAIKRVNNQFAYINLWHPKIVWISTKCVKTKKLHPNGSFFPFLTITKECCGGD